jgi:L-cysteine desulfidase
MNLLKEVLQHEVFPALGCTEPIAVAYAAGLAARELPGEVDRIRIVVDPGVYKNGLAVTIPNTAGQRGNLIAGVLGALIRRPELKMEILREITPATVQRAMALMAAHKARITYDPRRKHFFVDVRLGAGRHTSRAVLAHGHTHLTRLEVDRKVLFQEGEMEGRAPALLPYKKRLKRLRLADLVDLAEGLDAADTAYIRQGVDLNLRIAHAGRGLPKVGHYLMDLVRKGYLMDDVFASSKILVAAACDARMAGLNFPVMASGGSGNQGIVAILVPWNVGQAFGVAESTIVKSIALSHLVNSYIKCFTGDLSPLCGCAIAAGVGASVAIVFQLKGRNLDQMTLAVNSLVSDLGGMLCDGAKGGCALKVVSSTDAAIRAAYMAVNGHGITAAEGYVGPTAEETIRNLSRIGLVGMAGVDVTMLGIMRRKSASPKKTAHAAAPGPRRRP